jgi:hypothetical protein
MVFGNVPRNTKNSHNHNFFREMVYTIYGVKKTKITSKQKL